MPHEFSRRRFSLLTIFGAASMPASTALAQVAGGGDQAPEGPISLEGGNVLSQRRIVSGAGQGSSALSFRSGDIQLRDLVVETVSNADQLIGIFGEGEVARNIRFNGVTLLAKGTSGLGHGVNVGRGGLEHFTIRDFRVEARGYGLLVNSTASGSTSTFRLMDFSIYAGSDAIELNTPGVALSNAVIWGGHLRASPSRSTKTSGFALGMAHVNGFVAGGFISLYSTNEGLHVEDGSSFGVAAAFVLRRTGLEAIRHYRLGGNAAEATPIVFAAFSAERDEAIPRAGSAGFYSVYATGGGQGRSPIVAGFLSGYETGLRLEGPNLFAAGYVSVANAACVLKLTRDGKAMSAVLFADTVETLVDVGQGGAEVGAIHLEGGAPTALIRRSDQTYAPSCLSEFSCKASQAMPLTLQTGAASWIRLFPAPILMKGRLKVRCVTEGYVYWSGDLLYDGTSMTVTQPLQSAKGGKAVVGQSAIRVSGGFVELSVYNATANPITAVWCHFNGEYLV